MENLREMNSEQLVQWLYAQIDENSRLTGSQAASVEYHTTLRLLQRYLPAGSRVLDLGAGTGIYSFALAAQGHRVDALELANSNIEVFRSKQPEASGIVLQQGNALDLSRYESG
ncbi:MAG: class I SAM-dependent methyltransferase, partial [Rhodocyclaceae bacterium]|nr:class I SAM-dependent methyltransferase [Rhodocyclaceae bacterium]